jgi:hypothetical protein
VRFQVWGVDQHEDARGAWVDVLWEVGEDGLELVSAILGMKGMESLQHGGRGCRLQSRRLPLRRR